jgi:hypothetical protein
MPPSRPTGPSKNSPAAALPNLKPFWLVPTFSEWHFGHLICRPGAFSPQCGQVGANCSAVADWFNQNGMPVGKYSRTKKWDGHAVRRFYSNPILKGFPQRGARHTIKHHETGRRISVPNPKGPSFFECPHLAHLDPVFLTSSTRGWQRRMRGVHESPSMARIFVGVYPESVRASLARNRGRSSVQ